MNERNIQRKAKIKSGKNKGKFRSLSLHERIEKFGTTEADAATQLMAIKWLGNTGSHISLNELKRDDLLDAFEHFEFALELTYVKLADTLKERAIKIIKKKGPVQKSNKTKMK